MLSNERSSKADTTCLSLREAVSSHQFLYMGGKVLLELCIV